MPQFLHPDNLLSGVLVLIMFGIGATLRFSDFRKIFWRPGSLVLGLVLQMVFLPVLTFLLLFVTDIDPLYKVGFIVISLCPGGTTSNFISYLINADVALSISLTTINSFLILVTIPFGTNLALDYFLDTQSAIHLPFSVTAVQVFSIILLPACIGVLFNHFLPTLSLRLRMPLKVINAVLLGTVFSLKYFSSEDAGGAGLSIGEILELLPVALTIQVLAMLIAYGIATRFIQRRTSCVTIGIEVGLQNTTLALFITAVVLANAEISKPAVVYSMFSFFTTLLFAWTIYRYVILKARRQFFVDETPTS